MERVSIEKGPNQIVILRDFRLPRLKLIGLLTYGLLVYVFLGIFLYRATVQTLSNQVIINLFLYGTGVSFFYYYGFAKHIFTDVLVISDEGILRTRRPQMGRKPQNLQKSLIQQTHVKSGSGSSRDSIAFEIEVLAKDSGSYLPLISDLGRLNAQAIKRSIDDFYHLKDS